jgi:hypothetical protein
MITMYRLKAKSSYYRRRKRVTSVYLDEEQVEALKRPQEKTKVPTAVRIRDAIDESLRKHKLKPGIQR